MKPKTLVVIFLTGYFLVVSILAMQQYAVHKALEKHGVVYTVNGEQQ